MMSPTEALQGAGARLKAARLQRGLSLSQLAAQLKVPEARLSALEAERWEGLPAGPYARGLATAMCRALSIDAGPVLAVMPGAAPVALERVHEGLNRPFEGRSSLSKASGRSLLLAASAVVLIGLCVWALRSGLLEGAWLPTGSAPAADSGVALESVRHVEAPLVLEPASAASADGVRPTAAATVPAATVSSTPAPIVASAPMTAPTLAGAQTAPAAASQPATAPSAEGLSILARESTWVSVSDGAGVPVVSKLLVAGERIEVDPARAPLRVVLGHAAGAEVQWRGQVQDLGAFHATRVARLTLN